MNRLPIYLIPIILLGFSYFIIQKSYFNSAPSLNPFISSIPEVLSPTLTPTSIPEVTLGFTGDLGLGRHITSTARSKNDFSWSFQNIGPWLLKNDATVANLESPIIEKCPHGPTGTFTFCGDTSFLPYLSDYKFLLNLNNNHILNYGANGLTQTQEFLPDQSFYHDPMIKEINGLKFGFLGYDFITYPKTDTAGIITRIESLRPEMDYLIVSIHWGNEYLPQPETWRVKLAREMVTAGADIIHGHHPHVWQGVEEYRGKLIFYSFGNFIFDQSWSYETSHSQIARVKFSPASPLTYELFPIEIRFNSQPRLMP